MAIDLDAIRNRLNSLQTKVTKTDNLWKPQPGKQQIRIFLTFTTLQIHLSNYTSTLDLVVRTLFPSSFGEADPLLEFAEKLKAMQQS